VNTVAQLTVQLAGSPGGPYAARLGDRRTRRRTRQDFYPVGNQTKGYGDDSARIVLVIPFPRPSTTAQLPCVMYQ
jgi:hypothetical protein